MARGEKLFTVGPVMIFPDVSEYSGKQLPYFRTRDFSEIMLNSEYLLKKLLFAEKESRAVFLTASGTGAMEAAVGCTFRKGEKVLIVVGGGFGKRFAEICDAHGILHDDIVLAFGETFSESHLEQFSGRGYSGFLVNLDETSTGQLYDIGMISRFCRREGICLVADAISSFLADPVYMEKYGIDEIILSSQKALSLAPGLSSVVMGKKVFDERIADGGKDMYYLNLKRHADDQIRGQTPFTPAVGILLDLNSALRKIDSAGVESVISRTAGLASYFRKRASESGLNIPDYPLSNAVTPLIFEKNAYGIFETLRNDYGLTVTPSGGDLRDKVLRVGHIGNLSEPDYDELLLALEKVR